MKKLQSYVTFIVGVLSLLSLFTTIEKGHNENIKELKKA